MDIHDYFSYQNFIETQFLDSELELAIRNMPEFFDTGLLPFFNYKESKYII